MARITPAAPLDGPALLPDALIEQYVKPGDDQATLIDALRLTALAWVEQHTAHSLARRLWMVAYDRFDTVLVLPREPVHDVVSFSYTDPSGTIVSGAGLWRLVGSQILPAIGGRWPIAGNGAVSVLFEAGYDELASEAPALQIAALMLVKHLFDGGSLDDVPRTVTLLIDEAFRTPVMG